MGELILVDENDRILGYEEKLPAHRDGGRLHRAFSVFILNSRGEMLLQRRARTKYHFPGIWTNTCCSHPLRNEVLEDAVRKRLLFEMGIETELREVFSFIYRAEDEASSLVEHELDHVFVGIYDGDPHPNVDEVEQWKWMTPAELETDLETNPARYSPWFKIAMPKLVEHGVVRAG